MADEEGNVETNPKDLFRQVRQLMPGACIEDYYKMGAWKKELMEIDLELLEAHRREAGAPEPVPLEEIPEPEVPATGPVLAGAAGGVSGIRPLGVGTPVRPQVPGAVRPLGVAGGVPGRPQVPGAVRPLGLGAGARPMPGAVRPLGAASAVPLRPQGAVRPQVAPLRPGVRTPGPAGTPRQPASAPPPSVLLANIRAAGGVAGIRAAMSQRPPTVGVKRPREPSSGPPLVQGPAKAPRPAVSMASRPGMAGAVPGRPAMPGRPAAPRPMVIQGPRPTIRPVAQVAPTGKGGGATGGLIKNLLKKLN